MNNVIQLNLANRKAQNHNAATYEVQRCFTQI